MSFDPVLWAMKDAPVADVEEWAVLVFLSERADDDGEGAWPSVKTIAERTRMSESTVNRRVASLAKRGLIARGDQRRVAHVPRNRRPVVYDLMIPYHWFPQVDRINEFRRDHGRVPLTPEMRPKIALPEDTETLGVSPGHPNSGVSGGRTRGVRLTDNTPLSPFGTNTPHDVDTVDDAPPREDVEHLCVVLSDLVKANGFKPKITKAWRDEARRMIDIDERDPVKAEALMRWATSHRFWRSNIRSMANFRDKYPTLRLQAMDEWERQNGGNSRGDTGGHVRPDGEIDVDAVLGKDVWTMPDLPAHLIDKIGSAEHSEWEAAEKAKRHAVRLEKAKEVLRRRGYEVA